MFNQKEYQKKYKKEHKEELKEYQKEWYQENKEEKKGKSKKYRQEHKKEEKIRSKEYREKNPEKVKKAQEKWNEENPEYHKEYRKKNSEKVKRASIKWNKENPEKVKKNKRNYEKNRKKIDYKYHLNSNISTSIWKSLKQGKIGRHWEDLVDYTLKNLIIRLEYQFDENMNWNNYGNYWHIDHRKPKSLFHFNSAEEQAFKDCWCLANLRPLEKIENMKKHNKFLLKMS